MSLLSLTACGLGPEDTLLCRQIEVLPQAAELPGDGQSTTVVDLKVCACGDEASCLDENLLQGVSLELTATAGTLDENVPYLSDGTGSVVWTAPQMTLCEACDSSQNTATQISVAQPYDKVRGVLSADFLQSSFTGSGSVLFNLPNRYPTSFTLSTDHTELSADGSSTAQIGLSAPGLADGMRVSIEVEEGFGSILPAGPQPISGEAATFVYRAPSADAVPEVTTAVLLGKIDALDYYSEPLSITLNPTTGELSLSPESAFMMVGSSVTFVATKGEGSLEWVSPSADAMNCNGSAGLSACAGESKAVLQLVEDPCESEEEVDTDTDTSIDTDTDTSIDTDTDTDTDTASPMTSDVRCTLKLWVTDEAGSQSTAEISVY